jgi:hypothetical protein
MPFAGAQGACREANNDDLPFSGVYLSILVCAGEAKADAISK